HMNKVTAPPAALAILICSAAPAAQAPRLEIAPTSGLVDAPFHITLRDVQPGTRVKVSAARPDAQGRIWTAVAEYSVDADGRIDTDTSPSLGGSYEGVSAHGLWCSALPVAPERRQAYLADLPKHPELGTWPTLDVHATYAIAVTAQINGANVATT